MMLLRACGLRILASTPVVLLPVCRQEAAGVLLLPVAPVQIFWVGQQMASWAALLALCVPARVSRIPLRYFRARARGHSLEVPH